MKVELNKASSKLEQERSTQSELRDKLASVDSQMSGEKLKHHYAIIMLERI